MKRLALWYSFSIASFATAASSSLTAPSPRSTSIRSPPAGPCAHAGGASRRVACAVRMCSDVHVHAHAHVHAWPAPTCPLEGRRGDGHAPLQLPPLRRRAPRVQLHAAPTCRSTRTPARHTAHAQPDALCHRTRQGQASMVNPTSTRGVRVIRGGIAACCRACGAARLRPARAPAACPQRQARPAGSRAAAAGC